MDKNQHLIGLAESMCSLDVEFSDQSKPEQIFRSIWELEAQVNNGGFHQYYLNSSGNTAFHVVGALREIGALKAAVIVARAHSVFPDSMPPRDREERRALVEAFTAEQMDLLEGLDLEFHAYPDDLAELLLAFVERNPAVFER